MIINLFLILLISYTSTGDKYTGVVCKGINPYTTECINESLEEIECKNRYTFVEYLVEDKKLKVMSENGDILEDKIININSPVGIKVINNIENQLDTVIIYKKCHSNSSICCGEISYDIK